MRAVEERLPGLREELALDFVVANGENAADGVGLTPKLADRLLSSGVDVVTLGNHVWRRREIAPYLSGTDVYSPVDGTIVGITPQTLRGQTFGARIDIQPTSAPALVVRVTHLRPDPALTVGSSVASSISKIGTVIDFSQVEGQALARYTQDAGNHASIEVHDAATQVTP